jgi:hypothetical protein
MAIRSIIANDTHSSSCAFCFTVHYTQITKGAMKKFGIGSQYKWRGGGGGMDWFVYFKKVNIDAPVKTADLVQPLPKALRIFISTIPNGFQIANQKTRRRSKTLNGSHRIAGGPNLLKISATLPLKKIYELK